MICNVVCLKTRGTAAEQQFSASFSSLSVCHASSLKVGVLAFACARCVRSGARPCVLARVQLSTISWPRSDL